MTAPGNFFSKSARRAAKESTEDGGGPMEKITEPQEGERAKRAVKDAEAETVKKYGKM